MKTDKIQIIILGLGLAIAIALSFLVYSIISGKLGHAALAVELLYGEGNVTISGKSYGATPVYTEDVYAKDLLVEINGEGGSYSTTIRPAAGTSAIVKRDLGVNDNFRSGQNVWFEKNGGSDSLVSVTSSVDDVSVIVEGVEVGKTPVKFATKDLLSEKEDNKYKILFSKEGYEDQVLIVVVRSGYVLNLNLDMFLNPFPKSVSELKVLDTDGLVFLNLSDIQGAAFVDKQGWAKSINYWLSTREEVTLSKHKVTKFDYFIDNNGKVFNNKGNEIKPEEIELKSGIMIAYLGSQDEDGLSEKAKTVIVKATGKEVVETSTSATNSNLGEVKIKATGIGHLNVRSGAGTANKKVGTVEVGKVYAVLEKKNGWTKIEYEKGKEGWGIDTYLEAIIN